VRDEVNIKVSGVLELLIGMSCLKKVQATEWELDARTEQAPKTEPESRTELAPRTEPAERTELENNKIEAIKCPSCGYLLVVSKGTGKLSACCPKCGNVFEIE